MKFANPWYLCALLLIPLMEIWYRKYGKRKESVVNISSKELMIESFITGGKYRHLILRVLGLILLCLIILGLARPQYCSGFRYFQQYAGGRF